MLENQDDDPDGHDTYQNIFPKASKNCGSIFLAAYGKATCKPWRNESLPKQINPADKPGEYVITQMKRNQMSDRYTAATFYLDHFSGISFVYMQRDQSSKELIRYKVAFESIAKSHIVKVSNYPQRQWVYCRQ